MEILTESRPHAWVWTRECESDEKKKISHWKHDETQNTADIEYEKYESGNITHSTNGTSTEQTTRPSLRAKPVMKTSVQNEEGKDDDDEKKRNQNEMKKQITRQ